MHLKPAATKPRSIAFLHAISYRIPLPVREILLFPSSDSYPICPRCDGLVDREYMAYCDQCGQRLGWNLFEFASVVYAPRRKSKSNI